jgi:autotransporter family porin
MKLSMPPLQHGFYKPNALTASIRRGLIFSTVMLSVSVAFADIVIDDDASEGPTSIKTAPNDLTQTVNFADTSGAAIRINDTNGANGLLTINGGVTVSSSSLEAVILDGGGTTSVSITNAGKLSSVLNGLLVQNAAELTAFDNTGGIIESTGAAGAGLYLQEDQNNGITNAGIIRNISSGDGLKLDTEAQTQDFINSGTISSATGIAINADTAMNGATNGFVNSGTVTGGGGTAIDAEDAFKLTNSGTITGHIDHASSGSLTVTQTAGSISGNITSTADAAHNLSLSAGSITGNITLNGATANTFLLNGSTVNGNIDLGDGAANSVTLTKGSILGSLDIGANTSTVSINTAGGDSVTVTTFDSLNATVNMTGAGTFNSTTFDNNSTVNQSAGIANITTLNIGDNDTYTQTGTGVLNTTTTNVGDGATLTLLNQGTGVIQGTTDGDGSVVFSGSYNTDAALGKAANSLASVTVNDGQVLTLDQDSDVTSFNNNGTVNQSAGTLTAATLNIGDNDTYTQTGTGVLNTTTTNVGNGATLTLLNQGTGVIQGTTDGDGAVVFSGSYNTDAALGTAANSLASVTVNDGQVLTLDQDSDVTTFNNNGTVNQSAGTLTAITLNIGDNNTYTQTGTGVLNTTTTNVGNGATLTLLNQGTGVIRGTSDNQGDLIFSGSYTTDAPLGIASNSLASITINAGQTLNLAQTSDANNVVIAGILNKSSTNTMTGNTTINDGAIMNIADNFTHTGNLTVGQSGDAVVSINEGVTTVIDGDYTQTKNGIFQLGASSKSNYGQVTVSGTASFESNARFDVDVNTTNTLAVGETFSSVVSAGNLVSDGTFKVTDNSALFNFTGAINGNSIDIFVVNADSVVDIVERLGSPSALGAAAIFDRWVLDGGDNADIADVLQAFGVLETQQEVADAVESTIPGLSAGVAQATSSSINGLTKMIGSRQDLLRGLSSGDDLIANKNFWLAPYGSWTDQDDRQGVSGYEIDSYGLAMGIDTDISSSFNLGFSAAYTRSDIDSKLAAGKHSIDVDSYQAKLYATAMLGEVTALNMQLGGGISNYDSRRRIFNLDVADVDYDSWHAQFNAELEHSFLLENNVVMTPYVFTNYSYVDVEGYEEKGAVALNLTVEDDSDETLIVGLGSKVDYLASEELLLLADLGVGYDFMARQSKLTSAFEGGGGQFSTVGIKPDEFVYTAGLGFIYNLENGSEITGRYDFYGREDYTDQAISIRLSMLF